jgi:hypothetical protein
LRSSISSPFAGGGTISGERLHRLADCGESKPRGALFGLPVNGRRVSFDKNVFYEFRDGRIENAWSVIDKAAIASQRSAEAVRAL